VPQEIKKPEGNRELEVWNVSNGNSLAVPWINHFSRGTVLNDREVQIQHLVSRVIHHGRQRAPSGAHERQHERKLGDEQYTCEADCCRITGTWDARALL
jgi:hypothetical protein